VNFADTTLVRLADPATRAGVLDDAALEAVVAAAYDTDALAVEGPYQALFDEFRLGSAAPRVATADGTWNQAGGIERTEASFTIAGVGPEGPRIDAIWRGSVVARVVHATAPIESVAMTWPALGTIDADIESDLGALPGNRSTLDRERRARLIERLRATLDQPDRLDDARLDEVLAGAGAASVSDLLERLGGTVAPAAATVAFAAAPAAAPSPLALPVTAAVLVRDQGFSVGQLLADTHLVLGSLGPLSLERSVDPALALRNAIVAVWVVPQETFDDADWPGATAQMDAAQARAARRSAAAAWLAREGIGLAVPPS
jgi:hypothetical protein